MTGQWMTVAEVAEALGCSEQRAPKIMSENGVRAVRVYPADAVEAIDRPGQGARTDLRDYGATTDLTSWGSIGRHYQTPRDEIGEYLGEFFGDYDVDGLVDAYVAAVNGHLDETGITLVGSEFYARVPVVGDWRELIDEAIDAVALDDLVPQFARS